MRNEFADLRQPEGGAVVAALVPTVQDPAAVKSKRTRRRHHRPWYKRLWKGLFPVGRSWRVYIVLAVGMTVLAILVGFVIAHYS